MIGFEATALEQNKAFRGGLADFGDYPRLLMPASHLWASAGE